MALQPRRKHHTLDDSLAVHIQDPQYEVVVNPLGSLTVPITRSMSCVLLTWPFQLQQVRLCFTHIFVSARSFLWWASTAGPYETLVATGVRDQFGANSPMSSTLDCSRIDCVILQLQQGVTGVSRLSSHSLTASNSELEQPAPQ